VGYSFKKIRRILNNDDFFIIAIDVNKKNLAILGIRCEGRELIREDSFFKYIYIDKYSQIILFSDETSFKEKRKASAKISKRLCRHIIEIAKEIEQEKAIRVVIIVEDYKAIKLGNISDFYLKKEIFYFRDFLRHFTTELIRLAKNEKLLIKALHPHKTSSKCPICGSNLEFHQGRQAYCPNCRYIGDRDYTATLNLAKRLVKNLFINRTYSSVARIYRA